MATVNFSITVSDATDFDNKGYKDALQAFLDNAGAYFDELGSAGVSAPTSVDNYVTWANTSPWSSTDPSTVKRVKLTNAAIQNLYQQLASNELGDWDEG